MIPNSPGVYMVGHYKGVKKIGCTASLCKRTDAVYRMFDDRRYLICDFWELDDRKTAYAVEQVVHAMLFDDWQHGEFFAADYEDAHWCIDRAIFVVLEGFRLPGGIPVIRLANMHIERERTMAGLASARANGRAGGRKARFTDEQVLEAHRLHGVAGGARSLVYTEGKKIKHMSKTGFLKALERAQQKENADDQT